MEKRFLHKFQFSINVAIEIRFESQFVFPSSLLLMLQHYETKAIEDDEIELNAHLLDWNCKQSLSTYNWN